MIRLSVIVPVLDEAVRLPGLLARLAAVTGPVEVIVVDGGSRDGTIAAATATGARVIRIERGRGRQIATGIAASTSDALVLLHADTVLPPGGIARIAAVLDADPDLIGGNFRILFDGTTPFDRWLERFYAWIRRHGFYYGDSTIFIRRGALEAIGGLRPIPLMEDYDLVRRMERRGRTIVIDNPPVVTSSRKFAGRRPAAIVAGWLVIHALFHLGVPSLARLYYRRRARGALPAAGRS
ncbi:MAG: glycosyltransferase [Alphaproteobacteria bacterium]|nr:glycosyltransferase [Alphaproteobacteria bacterium]